MKRILSFLHIHWMRYHHKAGANIYRECRCGKREWVSMGGYSPLDRKWLNSTPPPPPPKRIIDEDVHMLKWLKGWL